MKDPIHSGRMYPVLNFERKLVHDPMLPCFVNSQAFFYGLVSLSLSRNFCTRSIFFLYIEFIQRMWFIILIYKYDKFLELAFAPF